jgi:hypothetical protein
MGLGTRVAWRRRSGFLACTTKWKGCRVLGVGGGGGFGVWGGLGWFSRRFLLGVCVWFWGGVRCKLFFFF